MPDVTSIVTEPKRILLRMPNWLGDAVMGTPLLEDLKTHYPKAELSVLCHTGIKILLEGNPFVDDYITFERNQKRKAKVKKELYNTLRMRDFDVGILLTRSFSSAWWFFRGAVKERIGFKDHFRSPLLTHALDVPKNEEFEHQVITYKKLLKPLGIPLSTTKPKLYVSDTESQEAKKFLREQGIDDSHLLIGINPGAAFGSAKCWLPDRFIELTCRLLENPAVRVVYFGDNVGKPLVDSICSALPKSVINLAGKTSLRSFSSYLSVCSTLVTNDSGPMHCAAALGMPLVAIFGSTNEIKTGPYSAGIVLHKHVACSPCYKRVCPIDFRCMTSISVDDVYKAISKSVHHDARLK